MVLASTPGPILGTVTRGGTEELGKTGRSQVWISETGSSTSLTKSRGYCKLSPRAKPEGLRQAEDHPHAAVKNRPGSLQFLLPRGGGGVSREAWHALQTSDFSSNESSSRPLLFAPRLFLGPSHRLSPPLFSPRTLYPPSKAPITSKPVIMKIQSP